MIVSKCGMGQYITSRPGVTSTLPISAYAGYGSFGAFGAIDFDADATWSDWAAGQKEPSRGARAADAIRAALSQIGYGPFPVGSPWGDKDKGEYSRFVKEQGVQPTPGMPTWMPNKVGLIKLAELVTANQNVGGKDTPEYHQVGDKVVAGPEPGKPALKDQRAIARAAATKAGMSVGAKVGIGVGALTLVVLGGVGVYQWRKKKHPPMKANGRRRGRGRRAWA